VAAAILVTTVVVIALPFWPGRMSADSLVMIGETKSGAYTTHFAPVLEALWHPLFKAGFGPGWVLVGQLATFVVGAFLIARLVYRPIGASLTVAAICLAPPLYGDFGWLDRNVWFLALLVASFGCLAKAFATDERRRRWWMGGVLIFAWLTLAARQNAAVSVPVPLALLAGLWLVGRSPTLLERRRSLVLRAVGLGLALTLGMLASQLVITRALGAKSGNTLTPLFVYDLASLSRLDDKNYFPPSVLKDRSMRSIDELSSVDSMNALVYEPGAPMAAAAVPGPTSSAIESAWLHRVVREPLQYLHERLLMMLDELSVTNVSIWAYHPFIDPNTYGYHTTFPWADRIANSYEAAFTDDSNNGDFLFTVWAYLLICVIAAVVLLRRRSWRPVLVGALALSALTYQIGFFFGLMGSYYSYELVVVAAGLLICAMALRYGWGRVRSPRPALGVGVGSTP
jgi:hypothetical protein